MYTDRLHIAVALAAMAAVCLSAPDVEADDSSIGSAEVREIKPLAFGQIGQPRYSTNTFTVSWQNGQVSVGGGGDGFYVGGATNGRYQVRGQPNQAATITAEIIGFSADGVTVEELQVNGNNNTYTTVFDGEGVVMIRIGGMVTIEPGATAGFHHTDLLITVDYE